MSLLMILLLLLLIIMLHVIHHHWNVSEMNTLDPLHKHVQWSGHGTKKHLMLNLSATKVFRGGAFFIVIVWIIFCENDTVYISIFLKTLWFFIFLYMEYLSQSCFHIHLIDFIASVLNYLWAVVMHFLIYILIFSELIEMLNLYILHALLNFF